MADNIALGQILHTEGNEPLSSTSKKLNVRASELEALIGSLSDTAVTDPAAVASAIALLKGSLSKLQSVITEIDSLEENTDGIEGSLTSLNGYVDGLEAAMATLNAKDYATQTTLAAVLTSVDGLESAMATLNAKDFSTQTTLAALKTAIDTLSTTVNQIKSVIDRDMRGLAVAKPAASAANRGYTYWSIDTDPNANAVEVSNGITWVVMS